MSFKSAKCDQHNIFINNTGNGTDSALCKFGNDMKLCSAIDSLKGRDDIEMDFDRPEKWDHLMRFQGQMQCLAPELRQFLDWGMKCLGMAQLKRTGGC